MTRISSIPHIRSERHPHSPVFPPLVLLTQEGRIRYNLCQNQYSTMALPEAQGRDQMPIFFQPLFLLQKSLMARPARVYINNHELVLPYQGIFQAHKQSFFLLLIICQGKTHNDPDTSFGLLYSRWRIVLYGFSEIEKRSTREKGEWGILSSPLHCLHRVEPASVATC